MTSKHQRATTSVTLKDIYAASQQIKTTIRRTPLDNSQELSTLVGAEIRLKMENLQQTGSFKLRGVSGYIEPSAMPWPLVRDRVDRVLTVSEAEIKTAMLSMLELHRHVVEPSGVPAVAGAIRYAKEIGGRKTVCVVTGRNISSSRYLTLLNEAAPSVDK
ncbi:pyridoxal-phosphate dependent enzyme [Pectobacterium betavasculorum]|uniref:Tryptophan synthase beta chain-like PALP domain-containing protein n=1 Tax=Pectobacterium betavasculorum TaxID=55207 RepID=A0ABR4UVV0_9GAMM|nr:pyridoxal-phosphate dependent enzyme [Pectobacterium betavasculorum]KFX16768.1 hypothetical protein JV35_17765 [Pectobacterium betavasculorum]